MIDEERWRPIPGHPGYEVSDRGRVRSLDRVVKTSKGMSQRRGKVLSTWVNPQTGYLQVGLSGTNHAVHVLVAAAFIGPRPEGNHVCHNDGVRINCHVSNLRYDTPSGNRLDKRIHGTDHNVNKTMCPRRHLLVPRNIVDSYRREGRRKCKACNRARAWLQDHPGGDFDAYANRQYLRIMEGQTI
ncbi:NUMOD4 domain-containing protein [Nocardia wallacei]|uniref:NUMOD4 domain-containing protein n=1 Tax=Nocardia wallacei TaxID=480035 RepID=UPI002453D8DC|nr:NUMOD4 domain-containing protein [Nocardia wallacei]